MKARYSAFPSKSRLSLYIGILYPDAQVKGFSGFKRMAPDSKAIFDKVAESLILYVQNSCE